MTRVYRLLLRLYPRWFRDAYQAELVADFEAERAAARDAGRFGVLRFWWRILGDLAVSGCRLRRDAPDRHDSSTHSGRGPMETLLQDIRHAARQLVRRPGFSAVVVLSLALGIGGNSIIFAFVDGFVLHPFAYPEPDRVVTIGSTFPKLSGEEQFIEALSIPEFLDLQQTRSIAGLAAFDLGNRNISGGDRPERVFTALTVNDLFAPFGLQPRLGRTFTAEELSPPGRAVAIISHRLWQARFNADPAIVGKTVRVNGVPTEVVGVMPPELLVLGTDLWLPYGADLAGLARNMRQFTLIGRLAPGVTAAQADAELAALAAQTASRHGAELQEYAGWRLSVTPWSEALMREIRPAMLLLLGAVGLVLLIACANVSNLLLARSTTRQREMAVRLALGAGRSGVARHLAAEIALLAAAGAGVGLLLAYVGLPAVVSLIPAEANTLGVTASINARVLLWTAAFTIGAAVLVGLLPVAQSARTSPNDALQIETRGTTAARVPLRLRHGLIVAEIALSVLLLAGAGLLVRSFARLQQVAPGFDAANVLTMRLTLPFEKYRGGSVNDFFERIVERLEAMPGVRAASAATQFPPDGVFSTPFRIEGRAAQAGTLPSALVTAVSQRHFATLGVPLVQGRGFDGRDRATAPPVAIVNQAFVSRYLPGGTALGQRVSIGPADRPSPAMEIVGIVASVRNRSMRTPPAPEIFVPVPQQSLNNQLFLLVRTEGDAAALLPAVRQQIAALDADQPVYAIRTLEQAIAADLFRSRFSMILFAVFAAIALTLAAIGIYGVMSYAVTARTKEIGVRLAVGADRPAVLWLVLRQVLRMTAVGLAIGLAGVAAAGTLLRGVLFEVQPTDPLTLAGVAIVLGSVALFAGWLPAWRASRVNPVHALRYE